ncbi:hypothetical protein [Levilactobacillus lettrarii]
MFEMGLVNNIVISTGSRELVPLASVKHPLTYSKEQSENEES